MVSPALGRFRRVSPCTPSAPSQPRSRVRDHGMRLRFASLPPTCATSLSLPSSFAMERSEDHCDRSPTRRHRVAEFEELQNFQKPRTRRQSTRPQPERRVRAATACPRRQALRSPLPTAAKARAHGTSVRPTRPGSRNLSTNSDPHQPGAVPPHTEIPCARIASDPRWQCQNSNVKNPRHAAFCARRRVPEVGSRPSPRRRPRARLSARLAINLVR